MTENIEKELLEAKKMLVEAAKKKNKAMMDYLTEINKDLCEVKIDCDKSYDAKIAGHIMIVDRIFNYINFKLLDEFMEDAGYLKEMLREPTDSEKH
tara:strand:- start:258 stop:545 length:288 start_codon:yes stop_codon:yes gene_type:complete